MTRTDIINALIEKYDLKSYLEIGVREGNNFSAIKCAIKHSVDPNFKPTYKMTSNVFFASKMSSVNAYALDLMMIRAGCCNIDDLIQIDE